MFLLGESQGKLQDAFSAYNELSVLKEQKQRQEEKEYLKVFKFFSDCYDLRVRNRDLGIALHPGFTLFLKREDISGHDLRVIGKRKTLTISEKKKGLFNRDIFNKKVVIVKETIYHGGFKRESVRLVKGKSEIQSFIDRLSETLEEIKEKIEEERNRLEAEEELRFYLDGEKKS